MVTLLARPSGSAVRVTLARVDDTYLWRGQELVRGVVAPKPISRPSDKAIGTYYFTLDAAGAPIHWFAAPGLVQTHIEALTHIEGAQESDGTFTRFQTRSLASRIEVYIPEDERSATLAIRVREPVSRGPAAAGFEIFERAFFIGLHWG